MRGGATLGLRAVAVSPRIEQPDPAPARPRPRRWAVTQDQRAVRLILWGAVGRAETAALDERLRALPARRLPVEVDLTGVTDLRPETVAWLGLRHEELGSERPLLVIVRADGPVHARLTRPGTPRLRLTLV